MNNNSTMAFLIFINFFLFSYNAMASATPKAFSLIENECVYVTADMASGKMHLKPSKNLGGIVCEPEGKEYMTCNWLAKGGKVARSVKMESLLTEDDIKVGTKDNSELIHIYLKTKKFFYIQLFSLGEGKQQGSLTCSGNFDYKEDFQEKMKTGTKFVAASECWKNSKDQQGKKISEHFGILTFDLDQEECNKIGKKKSEDMEKCRFPLHGHHLIPT